MMGTLKWFSEVYLFCIFEKYYIVLHFSAVFFQGRIDPAQLLYATSLATSIPAGFF